MNTGWCFSPFRLQVILELMLKDQISIWLVMHTEWISGADHNGHSNPFAQQKNIYSADEETGQVQLDDTFDQSFVSSTHGSEREQRT